MQVWSLFWYKCLQKVENEETYVLSKIVIFFERIYVLNHFIRVDNVQKIKCDYYKKLSFK